MDVRLFRRLTRLIRSVVSSLQAILKLLSSSNKETEMRGPIIKEHLTNATVAGAGSKEYYVKHDGRIMRVFVKGTVDGTRASGAVTVTLLPVAHFSDGKPVVTWPTNTAGNSDYLVYPPNGTLSVTATGAFSGCILTTGDGDFSEYLVQIANTTQNGSGGNLDATGIYLVTESA